MYICTSNEKNTLTSAQRQEDAQDVFSFFTSEEPIVFWQELRDPSHHDDIRAVEPIGYQHKFQDAPIAVSVPVRYSIGVSELHQTLPAASDGSDPARYFGVLKLEDLDRPTLNKFFAINTHFPHGSNWTNDNPTEEELAARQRWFFHFDLVQDEINRIKNLGFSCFWGGDHNRNDSGMPKYADNEKLAIGKYAIDKLYALDRSVVSSLTSTGTIYTPYSDHDARWAKWSLSNA